MKDGNGNIVNSPIVKTPQPRKFVCYEDPGHGWVKVSLFLLRKLNIADKITSYSYQRGDYVYLEEDCDFSTFYDAMSRADKAIKIESRHTDKQSKIRSYEPYQYHGPIYNGPAHKYLAFLEKEKARKNEEND